MFGGLIIEKNNNCLNKKTWLCFIETQPRICLKAFMLKFLHLQSSCTCGQ